MEDTAKNMQLFKESEGWKIMLNKINESIEYRKQILLGKANINILDSDMNKQLFNKYDLLRLELNHLEELKQLPDDIIRYNDALIEIPNKE